MKNILTGRVVKVIDEYRLVMNKGSEDGITENNQFLIYHLGEELFDPDTKQSLGILELVCGEGKPEYIQAHLTTLVTSKRETRQSKKVIKHGRSGISAMMGGFGGGVTEESYDPEVIEIPLDGADTDCLFKQIRGFVVLR